MTKRFHIIYPDDRYVDEDKIRVWFTDALDNGELSDEDAYECGQKVYSVDDQAMALHQAGLITLARFQPH